jgi:arsenite methyltransferase
MMSAKAVRFQSEAESYSATRSTEKQSEAFYLKAIPTEVTERDRGAGNPTKFLKAGESVLNLGCGSGKTAFLAAQIVGQTGRVTGLEMNNEDLAIAKQVSLKLSKNLGFRNIDLRKGRPDDLRMNVEKMEVRLSEQPVLDGGDLERFEEYVRSERAREPLIADKTVDAVVTNNVLTQLNSFDRERAIIEIYRTLKSGGRAILCELASNHAISPALKKSEALKTAGLTGAMPELDWLQLLAAAGFKKIDFLDRKFLPERKLESTEFHSFVVIASKVPMEK